MGKDDPAQLRQAMRVGLYGGTSTDALEPRLSVRLSGLQEFANRRGWTVVADGPGCASVEEPVSWLSLRERTSPPAAGVDLILVWRLDQTFASARQAAEELELLF
jgi:hypothetical protein